MTLMAAARMSAPVFPLVVEKSGVTLRDERAGDMAARERLLDRPLAAVDMRLPDRLVVRMNPSPSAATPPINPTQVRSTRG